ncbi:MAG TPA: phenylacetate--CoA ligase [Armatimonadetes bacterium]|jgi:phenylacetate-CoA ligase|nr:phenylacetate--CoA ligase [Armatimonadota bacterium]
MIWDKKHECMAEGEMRRLQLERLKESVAHSYNNVPFYRAKMDAEGVKPSDIHSLKDVTKLPFTTKDDMRRNYPYGLFAVPMKDVVRIHSSSGTTGKPTVVGYTRRDLEMWAECCARFITAAGVTSEDIAQVTFGYGLFTGGFGLHYGLERVGVSVIPSSSGNTARQLMLMEDFKSTTLICTPSYAVYLGEAVNESGIKDKISLKWGLFGSEPWTNKMRLEVEQKLGLSATDNYGLSEVIGPGVAGECLEFKNGMHICEDHFIIEVIDPETLEPKEPGEKGELVITALSKEAVPVMRYRTRDISRLIPEPCSCGRTTIRMEKVHGRTDDMFIIRGVNIFPSQVESALLGIDGTEPHYMLVLYKEGAMDALEVWVEVSEKMFSDKMKNLRALEDTIRARLKSALGIAVKLKLVEPRTIARSEGKAKRIIDNREKG